MKRFGENDARVKEQAGASVFLSFSFVFTEDNEAQRQARSECDYFLVPSRSIYK